MFMLISENRYLDALLKLILLTAVIHVFVLIAAAVINADAVYLNYFNILDIDLFFPGIEQGMLSHFFSAVAMLIVYIVIYMFFTKSK